MFAGIEVRNLRHRPTSSRFRCGAWLWASWCAGLAIAGCERTELPQPPDLGALLALYEDPDGVLEERTLASTLGNAFDTLATLDDVNALRVVSQLAVELESDPSPLTEGASGQNLLGANVRIVADILYRCRGDGAEADAGTDAGSEENFGRIELTALASLDGLSPTLWGSAIDCTERSRGRTFTLTGDVTAHLFATSTQRPKVLIVYEGDVTVDGQTETLAVDLQHLPNGTLRIRLELEGGGSVLVDADDGAPDVVKIRDSQGLWRCTPEPLRCRSVDDGRVLVAGSAA